MPCSHDEKIPFQAHRVVFPFRTTNPSSAQQTHTTKWFGLHGGAAGLQVEAKRGNLIKGMGKRGEAAAAAAALN